jgi:S-adenosylmethionine decarboxylase
METQTVIKEKEAIREFCGREGDVRFAGAHLLVELWTSKFLREPNRIRGIIIEALKACRATMLGIDLHVFSPNGGVSGVAILQESHLSIHTWPEYEYAAIDIFVCGTIDPKLAVPVLKKHFQPDRIEIREIKRGILP